MDFFIPKEATRPLPVALIIHGGAWVGGDRKDFNPTASQLAELGFAGVTVSYQLAKKSSGKFPVPVEDLRCAVKFLKAKANKFNLDPNRILLIGQSAGAHLALKLA